VSELESMPDPATLFGYEAAEPLCVTDVMPPETRDGATIRDIVYSSSAGTNVDAWLVAPSGRPDPAGESRAAVLFLHWLGHYDNNRDEFLPEAVALARRGVVSLLPTRLFPGFARPTTDWAKDRASIATQTIELRRGLDVLLEEPGVDPSRVAFVGHDYGAMAGIVLAAFDRRLKAVALMAPDRDWAGWFFKYADHFGIEPRDRAQYEAAMKALDPVSLLPSIALTPMLLQFSGKDDYVAAEIAREVAAAAGPSAKTVTYGDIGHDIQGSKAATSERDAWLAEQLGLAS
jgi:pimeloyl-ACP methyl ester carboxylesterase